MANESDRSDLPPQLAPAGKDSWAIRAGIRLGNLANLLDQYGRNVDTAARMVLHGESSYADILPYDRNPGAGVVRYTAPITFNGVRYPARNIYDDVGNRGTDPVLFGTLYDYAPGVPGAQQINFSIRDVNRGQERTLLTWNPGQGRITLPETETSRGPVRGVVRLDRKSWSPIEVLTILMDSINGLPGLAADQSSVFQITTLLAHYPPALREHWERFEDQMLVDMYLTRPEDARRIAAVLSSKFLSLTEDQVFDMYRHLATGAIDSMSAFYDWLDSNRITIDPSQENTGLAQAFIYGSVYSGNSQAMGKQVIPASAVVANFGTSYIAQLIRRHYGRNHNLGSAITSLLRGKVADATLRPHIDHLIHGVQNGIDVARAHADEDYAQDMKVQQIQLERQRAKTDALEAYRKQQEGATRRIARTLRRNPSLAGTIEPDDLNVLSPGTQHRSESGEGNQRRTIFDDGDSAGSGGTPPPPRRTR